MKRIALAVVLGVLLLGTAGPAAAGGSTWEFDAERYRPGDTAFAWASVAWEHNADLGTPRQGPYGAWLWRLDTQAVHPYGTIPDDAVRVADVVVSRQPYEVGGTRFGPHHATVEFVVPDLPPGRYELLHCNDPCTSTLGDITFGSLRIVAPPTPSTTAAPPPPTTIVAATPLVASSGSGGPPSWLPLVGAAILAAAAGGSLLWLLGERRSRQPTVKPT